MNNDPLQRRMFAQQMINQHAKANQPMGILASSPQLMGAVQGFKDGGAVKGYNLGGVEGRRQQRINNNPVGSSFNISDLFFNPVRASEINKNKVTKINNTIPTNEDALKIIKGDTNIKLKELPVDIDSFDEIPSAKGEEMQPNLLKTEKIEEPGATINNKLKKSLDVKKEKAEEKAEESNPYDNLSENYKTKLKNANALFDKATNDPKVTNEWKQKVEDIYSKEGKIDLDKIDKLAKEGAGIGDDNYDKRRSTAFWMGLIKGGLATAAGESSNALTNIAKGLMFGVDSFGKDINAINEDEREDRKEYGKLKVDLIKSEESKLLAHKSLELQYASKMYEINQNQNNFESKMDFQKAQAKINNEMQFETIEISKAKAWNDIKWKEQTYDLQLKEFALNKEKQADYVRLTTQQLKNAWDKGLLTDDMKEVIAMGSEYINVDDTGRFKSFTDLGQKALVTSKLTGNKITDLNTVGNGYVALGSVLGVKFLKEDGAVDTAKTKAAGLVWQESFADKWQKIQIKKASGTLNLEGQKAEEQRVLKDFADKTGGSYTAPSQTYDINGNPIN
jgi:hypothetical protein